MRYLSLFLIAAAGIAACDKPQTHQAVAATQPSSPATISVPNDGLIPGTPAGDLDTWVGEIRAGVARVPALLAKDAAAAQRTALDLYVTRQEYSEMYYGLDGRIKGHPELAQSIEAAEDRFHELMKLLSGPAPDAAAVQSAVQALDAQQSAVVKLWQEAGARINRPETK